MNSLEVCGEKPQTFTLKLQLKKGEIPEKLWFAASFYTSQHCPKTLAFHKTFCFMHVFPA